MGLFNASIFNNQIFNTSRPQPPEPFPTGGRLGRKILKIDFEEERKKKKRRNAAQFLVLLNN